MVRVMVNMERELSFEENLDPSYPNSNHQSNNSNWHKIKEKHACLLVDIE